MKDTLYDKRCEELAEHFLDDDETNVPVMAGIHRSRVVSLAQAIQEAVEAWIDDEPT